MGAELPLAVPPGNVTGHFVAALVYIVFAAQLAKQEFAPVMLVQVPLEHTPVIGPPAHPEGQNSVIVVVLLGVLSGNETGHFTDPSDFLEHSLLQDAAGVQA